MLHHRRIRIAIAILCLFFPVLSSAAEFSADFVVQTKDEAEMTGKIYVKGKKVKQEMSQEGERQIMIVRPDKGVSWMITPEEKMYMEIPYQSENNSFEEWSAEKESKSKFLGEETVSGLPCKKFENMEDGEKTVFWISKKYSFPVKAEDSESVLEYKNIKDGPVEDSQFELPPGLEKMTIPPMLMGDN